MDDAGALLDTIAARPADDLPRLVYADWLEDRGDTARAAFIRAHIQLARTPRDTPAFERLAVTASELFRAHYAEWFGDLRPPGKLPWRAVRPFRDERLSRPHPWRLAERGTESVATTFDGGDFTLSAEFRARYFSDRATIRRGFADRVQLPDVPADLSRHPIANLSLQLTDAARFLADQPALGRVRDLDVHVAHGRGGRPGAAVAESPHWRALQTLSVGWMDPESGARLVAAFAAAPAGRRIRVLRACLLDPPVPAALAQWPADADMEEICPHEEWPGTEPHGPADLLALAELPVARTLRRLSLAGCYASPAAVEAFVAGPAWDRLAALNFAVPNLADFAAPLARSATFPAVTDLRLANTSFDDTAALAFAGSPWPARLRRLDLSRTPVTIAGLAPLARALRDGPLERLDVGGCPLAVDDRHLLRDLLGPRVRFA